MALMQSQAIKLANNTLIGELYHYKSTKRLIVICHGYQSSSNNPTIVAVREGLNKFGHSTFTFNFSENTGGFDIEHQVKDIVKIVEYFRNYDEIVLVAASFAALTAAIATIQIPEVSRLITLNGFFGTGELGHEYRKNYIKFRVAALVVPKYRKILRYFKQELKPERIRVPVLVIHSRVDQYVFIRQSRRFYGRLTAPKHFVTLKSATHGITSPGDRQKVVSEIHKWLGV